MKRLCTTLLASAIAMLTLAATPGDKNKTVKKGYDTDIVTRTLHLPDFSSIYLEGLTEGHFAYADSCSVRAEATEHELDSYDIEVKNGTLHTSAKNTNGRVKGNITSPKLKLYITAPDIHIFHTSGASTLTADSIHCQRELQIITNGASAFTTGNIVAEGTLSLETKGVSRTEAGDISATQIKLATIGSSNLKAGSILTDGDNEVTCSGVSHVACRTVTGNLVTLTISGSSNLKADSIKADGDGRLRASGVSGAEFGVFAGNGMDVQVNASSHVDGDIRADGDANVGCSGVSHYAGSVMARHLTMEMKASSNAQTTFKGLGATLTCNGVSNIKATVDCDDLKASATGSSHITLKGTADKLDIDTNGISGVYTSGLNKF